VQARTVLQLEARTRDGCHKFAIFSVSIIRLDSLLKGLSHEIDFKNVVENGQILALIRAAAGFLIFRRLL
jgi:hypothetical protein